LKENTEQKRLEEKIEHFQKLYYGCAISEITDEEFDNLWDELSLKYPDSYLLEDIGKDDLEGTKVKHVIQMGSQEKVTTLEELHRWITLKGIKFPLILEDKLDGISVELVYKNGYLVEALTRGNGIEGSSILKNVNEIPQVPKTIDTKEDVYVRGEIVMILQKLSSLKGFEDREVLSPRNIAAGIAYQKYETTNCDCLEIVCYDVKTDEVEFKTELDKITFLKDNKFLVPQIDEILKEEELETSIEKFEAYKLSKDREYDIDGVVLKQDIIPKNVSKEKLRPDHQRAFKWKAEEKWTELIDVEWSRNGNNYTPVAILKPVELSGTIVEKASLANIGEMKRLKLTECPSNVLVTKRGEIIPKVIEVKPSLDSAEPIGQIAECPFCNKLLTVTDTKIFCSNEDCSSRKEHIIKKWISVTGALGFGPSLINHISYVCNITEIIDLYKDDSVKNILLKTNKKKATEKAFEDLYSKSKNMKLEDVIAGFDIDGIGSKVVKLVIDRGFNSFEKLMKITYSDLIKIDGFGEVRALTFSNEIPKLENKIKALLDTGLVTIAEVVVEEVNTDSKVFVVSGRLTKPRREVQKMIKEHGHSVRDYVNSKVSYLVNNDFDSRSSKNLKAKRLGIEIINEERLEEILKGN